MVFSYLKNNFLKCIPLLTFSFVFTLLFLYSFSIIDTNTMLKNQIENSVTYTIEPGGRLFQISSEDTECFLGEEDLERELNKVMSIVDAVDASYDLMASVELHYWSGEWVMGYNSPILYGVSNNNFFEENDIENIDGVRFSDNLYEIIVPEGLYIDPDSKFPIIKRDYYSDYYKKVNIGDTIVLPLAKNTNFGYGYDNNEYIEFKVIGFYKKEI